MRRPLTHIFFLLLTQTILLSCNGVTDRSSPDAGQGTGNTPVAEKDIELRTSPNDIKLQLEKSKDSSAVFHFYKNRNFAPAWSKGEIRSNFVKELQKADLEGLLITDYYNSTLRKLQENTANLNRAEIARLDLLLTKSFFSYANDLYYGKLDPNKLNDHWGVSRKRIDLKKLLQEGLEEGDIIQTLTNLKPPHQIYHDLKKSLLEYTELREQEKDFTKIEFGAMIRPGEKDPRLPAITQRLQELGLLTLNGTDSIYSNRVQETIREFQKEKGLEVDGIIGNSTIAELNMTSGERYKQILANLERWRWYPRDLGEHYILINIPQFKLAVVKNGDTIRTHNIIAGTRTRQTPIFTDTLQYVVINPTWTVPPTIKTKDVIPKASQNPDYLASHNMKVYGKDGKVLDPNNIDWNNSMARSYTIVQRAGPSNPLGKVKIIYPNRYLIYLHDTPAQSLFSQNQRAESSGCVRVEDAVDLSAYVLSSHEEWSKDKIREVIASGKTTEVKINQPIQVHHFYWTAWRAGNKTVFTEDVYKLDKLIYSSLLNKD